MSSMVGRLLGNRIRLLAFIVVGLCLVFLSLQDLQIKRRDIIIYPQSKTTDDNNYNTINTNEGTSNDDNDKTLALKDHVPVDVLLKPRIPASLLAVNMSCIPDTVVSLWNGESTAPALSSGEDVHIFVIWHGAYNVRQEILDDIQKSFAVLRVFEMKFRSETFLENLWRLYKAKGGTERRGMEKKVTQCGLGAFTIAVVQDTAPSYRVEGTAHGRDCVNSHINRKKAQYRRMSNGGFRVHGTFSPLEADHDIMILFGVDRAGFLEQYPGAWNGRIISLMGNTAGWDHWADAKTLCRALSVTTKFKLVLPDDLHTEFECSENVLFSHRAFVIGVSNLPGSIATVHGVRVLDTQWYNVAIGDSFVLIHLVSNNQLAALRSDNEVVVVPSTQEVGGRALTELRIMVPDLVPLRQRFPISIDTSLGEPVDGNFHIKMGSCGDIPITLHRGRGSAAIVWPVNCAQKFGQRLLFTAIASDPDNRNWTSSVWVSAAEKRINLNDTRHLYGTVYRKDVSLGPHQDIYIKGNLHCDKDCRLTIYHGTRVFLEPEASILIEGVVYVLGNYAAPVFFTCSKPYEYWHEVALISGGQMFAMHLWMVGGGSLGTEGSFGHSNSAAVVRALAKSVFTMQSGGIIDGVGKAIGSTDARVSLFNSIVARCDTGGEHMNSLVMYSRVHVTEMPDADRKVEDDDNDGIYIHGSHSSGQPSIIENSVFSVGEDDGIDQNGAYLIIKRTWVEGYINEGIALSNSGPVFIEDSVIRRCGQGVECGYGHVNAVVERSLLEENDIGIRFGDSYDWSWGREGHMRVLNSVSRKNDRFNAWNFVYEKGGQKKEIGSPKPDALNISCSHVDVPVSPTNLKSTSCEGEPLGPNMETTFPRISPWSFVFNCTKLTFGKLIEQGAYKKLYRGIWRGHIVAIFRFKFNSNSKKSQPSRQHLEKLGIELERRSVLRHLSLAPILGVCFGNSTITMIEEFFVGQRISGTGLSTPAGFRHVAMNRTLQVDVSWQLASGLAYLHYGSPLGMVVHHDFKPANVLISPDGRQIRIVDFDTALIQPRGSLHVSVRAGDAGCGRRVCPGVEKYWNSPECFRCADWNEKYEVWNLGIMLMMIVSGKFPHYKDLRWTSQQYYDLVGTGKEMPQVPKSVFPELRKIIESCLQFDSTKRPRSDEVANELFKLLWNMPEQTS